MPVLKLTQAMFPQALQCPQGKSRIEMCDADCPGLYFEVRATNPGHGTAYLRYKDNTGKTCHQRLTTCMAGGLQLFEIEFAILQR